MQAENCETDSKPTKIHRVGFVTASSDVEESSLSGLRIKDPLQGEYTQSWWALDGLRGKLISRTATWDEVLK